MTTTRPTSRSYAGAVASASIDAVFGGAWVAARGLTTTRRRVARAGIVAASFAASGAVSRLVRGPAEPTEPDVAAYVATRARPLPTVNADDEFAPGDPASDDQAGPRRPTPKQLALLAGVTLASAAVMYGGSRLEKRWLAGLVAKGHPHPHLGLGWRMAAVSLAATLPSRIAEVRLAQRSQDTGLRSAS
jgi:hypothetical protein